MKYWFIISLFLTSIAKAQVPVPVSWHFNAKKTVDKTYEVHISAVIDEGWHIYAQHQPEGAISQPTKISFTKSPLLVLSGEIKEHGTMGTQKIPVLDTEQYYYTGEVDFVQQVKLKTDVKANLSGTLTFQACTDKQCLLPQTIPFSLSLQ